MRSNGSHHRHRRTVHRDRPRDVRRYARQRQRDAAGAGAGPARINVKRVGTGRRRGLGVSVVVVDDVHNIAVADRGRTVGRRLVEVDDGPGGVSRSAGRQCHPLPRRAAEGDGRVLPGSRGRHRYRRTAHCDGARHIRRHAGKSKRDGAGLGTLGINENGIGPGDRKRRWGINEGAISQAAQSSAAAIDFVDREVDAGGKRGRRNLDAYALPPVASNRISAFLPAVLMATVFDWPIAIRSVTPMFAPV